MKKLTVILASVLLLTSCSDELNYRDSKGEFHKIEPYGWADYGNCKLDGVQYKPVVGNVVWSIIGIETIAVPVILSGWYIMEPVKVTDEEAMLNDLKTK